MKSTLRLDYQQAASVPGHTHWWVRGRQDIFSRLLADLVSLPEGARILDVGPGYGVNIPVLGNRGRLCALDTDIQSLSSCRALGVPDLVVGDARRLPLADGSVHLVTALDVLEHLDDDLGALEEFHRVLRADGWLLLAVPALQILWGRQDLASEHHRRYHRRQLRERLRAAGFDPVRLTYFNTLLFPPILVVRLLMRPFLGRARKNDRTDFGIPLPLGLNGLLHRLFAAEARWLVRHDLPVGVSLLCLARPTP